MSCALAIRKILVSQNIFAEITTYLQLSILSSALLLKPLLHLLIFLTYISGFHEAVGDTIALSVSSPKHLRRVGLSTGDDEDEQTEINQLYKMVSRLFFW